MQVHDAKTSQQPSTQLAEAARPLFRPNIDIVRSEDGLLIYADLPGVEPEGIEVNFERGVLELRARVSARNESQRQLRREYAVGDFMRTFRLADEFDGTKASAEYHDGVLRLRVPKSSAARARKVEIRAGRG